MAVKPTKLTVPDAPERSDPGTAWTSKADAMVAFQGPLVDYIDAAVDFVDDRADAALAAALMGDLPSLTGKELNIARVNAAASGLEFRTPAQFVSDVGLGGSLAPKPVSTVSAVGQWVRIFALDNTNLFLPAGGTWAYCVLRLPNVVVAAAGVAAGGTLVVSAQSTSSLQGFAWRVA